MSSDIADVQAMRPTPWRAYFTLGVVTLVVYFLLDGVAQAILYQTFGAAALIAIVVGIRRNRPSRLLPWLVFATAVLLQLAGDLTYFFYENYLHVLAPFPSAADAFYLSSFPTFAAALFLMARAHVPERDWASVIDAVIIASGVGVLTWIYLVVPYADDPGLTLLERTTSIAYPLMDLVILTATLRLAVTPGTRVPALNLLGLSFVVYFVTDICYAVMLLEGTYRSGSLIDAGWLFAAVLWGATPLHPSMRKLTERSSSHLENRLSAKRLILLAGASLLVPGVMGVQIARDQPLHGPVVAAGSAVLFCLVLGRMFGLMTDLSASVDKYRQAIGRERTLRRTGAKLALGQGRDDIHAATLDASIQLASGVPNVRASVWTTTGGYLAVGATAGHQSNMVKHRSASLSELSQSWTTALLAGRAFRVEDGVHMEKLVGPARKENALIVPLNVLDRLAGALVVEANTPFPDGLNDAFDALASQVGLSLEGVALTQDLLERKSEARFRSLVQSSSDVILIIEPDATIHYQSSSATRILGYKDEEMIGTKVMDWLHPDDCEVAVAYIGGSIGRSGAVITSEWRLKRHDDSWVQVEVTCNDLLLDPNVAGVVLTIRDISERKAFEEELTRLAFHDSLTALPNRALFKDRVEHAIARIERTGELVTVLFLDIDDFKSVNDTMGHVTGDCLLRAVGERLSQTLRPADTVARFGGDEFAVLLESAKSEKGIDDVAKRILCELCLPFALDGTDVFVGASLGAASTGSPQMTADELLHDADIAMYTAKGRGKNSYATFDTGMHTAALERMKLKSDLQRAFDAQEFVLDYQPIVSLRTGETRGVEALVRWQHPEHGLIAPMEFIALAEETGIIVALGRWVLEKACLQGRLWQIEFPGHESLVIHVNFSARQLQEAGIVDEVARVLLESHLEPRCLCLEITESVLMHNRKDSIFKLQQLRELGVRIFVDDFGTGYSSLSYLDTLPIDGLKIGKSFVDHMGSGLDDSTLTVAVIKLSRNLNLQPIAEGIETAEQAQRLRDLECDLGQGYLFAKPLTPEEVAGRLTLSASRPSGSSRK